MTRFRKVQIFLICLIFHTSVSLELIDYKQCCHYCRGDQDLWVQTAPAWHLTVEGDHVTSFDDPPAYLLEDDVEATAVLYSREYTLRYAGAPVSLLWDSTTSAVLAGQYVQVDLGFSKDVAGVSVQGGYYEEADDDLVGRAEFSVTRFAVSTAMSAGAFSWVKDYDGNTAVFEGSSVHDERVLAGFDHGAVAARHVRVHPLGARDGRGEAVDRVLMRVSVLHCTTGTCHSPRANCVLREWQGWGACTCDWAGCRQARRRKVARYQACGGAPCDVTEETQLCVPPEPLWKTVVLGVGVGLLGLILLVIIAYFIYRKWKKSQPEIVFEKDKQRKKREKKSRKMRKDLAGESGKLEETKTDHLEETNDMDFAEKELSPADAALGEKQKTELEVAPAVVVTADDAPVMNADNQPVRPISKMGKPTAVKVSAAPIEPPARSTSEAAMDELMDDIVQAEGGLDEW